MVSCIEGVEQEWGNYVPLFARESEDISGYSEVIRFTTSSEIL